MAEYLGIPIQNEKDDEEIPDFQSICNLWARSDQWPLEDAVRLTLRQSPRAFITDPNKEGNSKSVKIIFSLALNCVGFSLRASKGPREDEELHVIPKDFISWAREKEISVPSELDLALTSEKTSKKENDLKRGYNVRFNHRERVKAVAGLIWDQDPRVTTKEMANRTEILEHGCENQYYAEAVLIKWLEEIN